MKRPIEIGIGHVEVWQLLVDVFSRNFRGLDWKSKGLLQPVAFELSGSMSRIISAVACLGFGCPLVSFQAGCDVFLSLANAHAILAIAVCKISIDVA